MAYKALVALESYCKTQLRVKGNNKAYYCALANTIEALGSLKRFW